MRSRILPVLALLAAVAAALAPRSVAASPYAYYAERQRGETLTIRHSPAPGIVVRNVREKRHGVRAHAVRHRVIRRHVAHRRVVQGRRAVANVRNPEIAGFCRDGGAWLKRGPLGEPRGIVQKEVCDSVAWYSRNPDDVVIRPDKSGLLPF